MKIIFLFCLITIQFCFQSYIFSQSTAKEMSRDYIVMKNGHVVIGTVTNMKDSVGLDMETELGGKVFIPYDDIRKGHRKPPLINLMNASYAEIGITYGTPGFVNFVFGYSAKKTGIRLSGMHYGDDFTAFQLHLGHKLLDNNRQRHSVGFTYGQIGNLSTENRVGYAGIAYSYTGTPMKLKKRHHAWFAEIGYANYFSINKNDRSDGTSFGPTIQVGYVYRFIQHAPRVEQIPIPRYPKQKKEKKKRPPRPIIKKEKIIVKKNIIKNKIKKERKPCPKCIECPENIPCPDCPICLDCPDELEKITQDSTKTKEKSIPDTYLLVRDNGIADGDIISIKLNDQVILEEFELTKIAEKIFIKLIPKKKNKLTIHAHNMGKSFPNTSIIIFVDEKKGKKKRFNIEIEVVGEKEIFIKG